MDNRLQNLGLAYKANKVLLGEDILSNLSKVKLLFIAEDISITSRERLSKKCLFYNIDYIDTYLSKDLSNALGKKNIKSVAIIDEGFKKLLMK